MPNQLEYGSVIVNNGTHKGKIGYYDDDGEKTLRSKYRAIVYFGEPFVSEPKYIDHENLENVSSIQHEKWKKENPEIVKKLGVY